MEKVKTGRYRAYLFIVDFQINGFRPMEKRTSLFALVSLGLNFFQFVEGKCKDWIYPQQGFARGIKTASIPFYRWT
jgi:hypothetical protein